MFALKSGLHIYIVCLSILVLSPVSGVAQNRQTPPPPTTVPPPPNTVLPPPNPAQSPINTVQTTGNGDGSSEAIKFSASDSLTFRAKGTREARLYGSARVDHPSGNLSAGVVTLNLSDKLMSATTVSPGDTLSEPLLQRGEDLIRSRRILYNYETEKGKFNVARVTVDNANVVGDEVKRPAQHVIFISDGIYSTCELDHPHYYIRASRMKIVDEEEVFFTRARLYILDIPYPFIFPFGLVPSRPDRKRSGLLEPSFAYQDQNGRGIGIQSLGWFQYFNDYIASTVRGDVFTSGTFYVNNNTQYNYKNIYRGSVQYSYSLDRGLESTDPDFSRSVQQMIGIQHSQQISPFASFNADISLRTSQFYNRNSYNIDDRANTSTTSRIAYNYRHPEGNYTFGANVSQSQNFRSNTVNLQGPTANFSIRRRTPFQPKVRRANPKWYETVSYGYSNRFNSRFTFTPLADADPDITWVDALLNPSQYREATGRDGHIDYGFNQQGDVTAQLIPSDFANLTASLRANEYWYPNTIERTFDTATNTVQTEIVNGFATARDFSTSLSLSTTVYGISNQNIGTWEGFRHTLRPSVSYNYRPDFSKDTWGYFATVQTDTLGNTRQYNRFERGIFGSPAAGEQQAISFSLDNVFETKSVQRDTTGERQERIIRLIDNARASASYNFAASQYKLSDLSTSLTSSFIRNINLNVAGNFSFYDTDSLGSVIPQYLWDDGKGLLRLTRFTARASTQFSSNSRGMQPGVNQPYYPRYYDPFEQDIFRAYDEAINYTDISPMNASWSFSLSFNYSWQYVNSNTTRETAIVNAQNIRFRLTPEWNVGTSLGYDFIAKELTPTRFNVTRNLHCWDLSFDWNPFGDFQFFMFRLTIRDSQMQSLFQMLPGLNNLERSSSPINRGRYY